MKAFFLGVLALCSYYENGGFSRPPLKVSTNTFLHCERIEPRSHFKSRFSLIVRVNAVLNRNVVFDNDWRFDNLCGSHLQRQSELYHVSWWYYTRVIDLIGQLRRDFPCLSVTAQNNACLTLWPTAAMACRAALWNFIGLVPSHSIRRMLAIFFSGAEF